MNAPLRDPMGNAHPVAELFAEHGDFIYRTLRYRGVDAAAVDDLLQDVFVTAYRRWDAFEGRSTPRTWLYGIARRVAFRHRRKQDNWQRRIVLDDAPEGVAAPFERDFARRSVMQLLDALDEDKRAAFLLCEVEGFTAAEASAALGVPLGTVYSRVRAAWQRLRRDAALDEAAVCEALARPRLEEGRRETILGGLLVACAPSVTPAAAAMAGWIWVVVGATAVSLIGGVAWASRASDTPTTTRSAGDDDAPPAAIDPDHERAAPAEVQAQPEVLAQPRSVPRPAPPSRAPDVSQPDRSLDTPPHSAPRSSDPVPSPKRAADASSLPAELALLRAARQAQRAGDDDAARRALQRHAREFPDGQLSAEREEALTQLDTAP